MKAKLVKENLDFERGQEPSKAMGIGLNEYVIVYCGSTGEIDTISLMRGRDENDIMVQLFGNDDPNYINDSITEGPAEYNKTAVYISKFVNDFSDTELKFYVFDKYNKFPKK